MQLQTRSKLVRHVLRVAAVATLAGGGLAVAASPAIAIPTQCSSQYITDDGVNVGAVGRCLSGAGQHQINVMCRGITGDFLREGPWRNTGTSSGRRSTVNCPLGTSAISKFQTYRT